MELADPARPELGGLARVGGTRRLVRSRRLDAERAVGVSRIPLARA